MITFKELHPKSPAKSLYKKSDPPVPRHQSNWFRYQCGICKFKGIDIRRDSLGDGEGYVVIEDTSENPNGDSQMIQHHTGGCPMCHSMSWR